MWRSVGILLWKNWRVKQRNSRLNRGRTGKRWLFPALVTDVIMPLGLLLLLIQTMCRYNAELAMRPGGENSPISSATAPAAAAAAAALSSSSTLMDIGDMLATADVDGDARRRLTPLDDDFLTDAAEDDNVSIVPHVTAHDVPMVAHATPEPVTLLLALLPLLLARSNQSLAFVDREDTVRFLHHLDQQYPSAPELGISSYMDVSKLVPFNSTMSNDEATEALLEYPTHSGVNIYAGLDVRRVTAREEEEERHTLELLTLFSEEQTKNAPVENVETQVDRFAINELTFDSGGTMLFPYVLPFQMSLNMLLRESSTSFANDEVVDINTLAPNTVCRTVNKMLHMGGLRWGAFPATSPLGRSMEACRTAVKEGKLSPEIHHFLSNLVGKVASNDELDVLVVSVLPSRSTDTIAGSLQGNIVFYMAYLFMWPYVRLICDVVGEKEKQLKEYLMIMGLPATALLASWFLLYISASAVVALMGAWLLSGSMFAATLDGQVYFFLLLIAFVSSILLFGIAITPLFNQTKTAAACAPMVYFVLSAGAFIRSLVGADAVASSTSLAMLLSVLDGISSPVVFMSTLRNILALDATTGACRPITWNTVATPYRQLASQCAGYLLLGWYLENVFPRTYGVQQKWYFVFQASYWFPKNLNPQSDSNEDSELAQLTEMNFESIDDRLDDTLREQTLSEYMQHFRPSLFVRSLSKTYPNGKVALRNVSFGVKKGEIFGLLGPNGAGKSTTLSILSGIIPPTSGDAYVGGSISVATNPQAVRKSLSVCFQQNILYDNLSVWEHLWLVCALKNSMGIKTVPEEAWPRKLQQFGLDEKHDALSKTLSGGQKRKLSLVLALLDSSRVLLLDEPTAGMDMRARLDTWDTLKRAVTHRAVILTTHSMQEAQALCENIGIVADGKLKCCGSSLFLQNQYGVGYKLTIVHCEEDDQEDDDHSNLRSRRQLRTDQLMKTLTKHVPNAAIVSDSKWETRVRLTDGKEKRLAELFKELETMKQAKTIKRYAIAATGLEDVFVKVTEGEDVYNHAKDDVKNDGGLGSVDAVHSKMEGGKAKPTTSQHAATTDRQLSEWESSISKIRAMVLKRAKMGSRDKKALFAQFVWPLGFFTTLMGVLHNLLTSQPGVEVVTSLPPAARGTSFYISSAPSAIDSVSDMVAQMELSSHPIVFDRDAQTEQAMLDAIASERATTYFAGVFVSDVNWTTTGTISSEVMIYSLYYNETVRRSLPVTLQWMSQAYCKARAKHENAPKIDNCELVVKKGVYPMDLAIGTGVTAGEDGVDVNFDEAIFAVQRVMVSFYLLMAMSSIIGYYAALVVREKECGLKRLQYQHIGTANASVLYWSSNLLFDYSTYMLAVIAICVILAVFSAALNSAIILAWFVSMACFGLAILPAQYLTSLIFSSHASAQSYMSYASLFQIVAVSVVFALSMIPGMCSKVRTASYFLQAFPLYTFGNVVLEIGTVSWAPMRQQCLKIGDELAGGDLLSMLEKMDLNAQASVWDWNVAGNKWFAMLVCSVVYTSLLLVVDFYQMYPTEAQHKIRRALSQGRCFLLWRRSSYGRGYAEAVQTAVDEECPDSNMVHVTRVSKVFNPQKKIYALGTNRCAAGRNAAALASGSGQVVALHDVSFSVKKRDCVALLGVNGSGKSTMFNILTAAISPTRGKATIDSCDVTNEPRETSMRYGYCPQGNLFYNDMSVREHLELFYRLQCRGHDDVSCEGARIDDLVRRLDLLPVENTAALHLSGGNKRRLMLALSLLGDRTTLLLLDEPSAGVDVVARRLMWRVLHEKRQSHNRLCCLFTTHSMEEAEAVCANAVVLLKGKTVWCGSIPDLKQRVSRGISISVRLDSPAIWNSGLVKHYTEEICRSLQSKTPTGSCQKESKRSSLSLGEVNEIWELCHGLMYKDHDAASTRSRQRGKIWLAGLRARFGSEANRPRNVSKPAVDVEALPVVPIVEFVQEWLVQEAFVRLESQLFTGEFTSRSGEPVTIAAIESARGSGNNTSRVYETSCTDAFGLADVFALMEANKQAFNVLQYSVSEMSLERMFEQFTGR
ncbi:unnamed protein product [Hyaloperonospora brassicae]|uniref:ABC transporter domain-containing protein n=1 Tax=Hyaloperonospora brassicae TaxID=162125 RepID=A0AAV0UDH8_HYABA|nr:unnamed protein product [Hyaloperonospora brassicae]